MHSKVTNDLFRVPITGGGDTSATVDESDLCTALENVVVWMAQEEVSHDLLAI